MTDSHEQPVALSGHDLARETASGHSDLARFLIKRVRNPEDAHDIAQEAYMRLAQAPDADLIENPVGYLYRIATNIVAEYYRKKSRSPEVVDLDTLSRLGGDGDGDQFDRHVEARSDVKQLEAWLETMPAVYKNVLILRKRDNYSHAEIAEKLDISTHTVHKYLTRALAHIRENAVKTK